MILATFFFRHFDTFSVMNGFVGDTIVTKRSPVNPTMTTVVHRVPGQLVVDQRGVRVVGTRVMGRWVSL